MGFEQGSDGGDVADLLGGAAGSDTSGGNGEPAADAGAAAGAGGTGGEGDGSVPPEWLGMLSDKPGDGETVANRDYIASKGFKDVDSLAKSYREAEKSLRDGGRIKVPGENAKPEEMAAYRAAIGVPDKAEDYAVQAPDGRQLDDSVLGPLRESALRHGAPKAVFEGLVSDFVKIQLEQADAETKRQDELASTWLKDQGGKKDEQLAHINTAARSLGFTKTDMSGLRQGLGADRALSLLAKLGAGMAEDVLITGGSNRFGVSGAEAKAELDKLMSDAEFQAKNVPGSPERQRWDRLNAQAAEYAATQEGQG